MNLEKIEIDFSLSAKDREHPQYVKDEKGNLFRFKKYGGYNNGKPKFVMIDEKSGKETTRTLSENYSFYNDKENKDIDSKNEDQKRNGYNKNSKSDEEIKNSNNDLNELNNKLSKLTIENGNLKNEINLIYKKLSLLEEKIGKSPLNKEESDKYPQNEKQIIVLKSE